MKQTIDAKVVIADKTENVLSLVLLGECARLNSDIIKIVRNKMRTTINQRYSDPSIGDCFKARIIYQNRYTTPDAIGIKDESNYTVNSFSAMQI